MGQVRAFVGSFEAPPLNTLTPTHAHPPSYLAQPGKGLGVGGGGVQGGGDHAEEGRREAGPVAEVVVQVVARQLQHVGRHHLSERG